MTISINYLSHPQVITLLSKGSIYQKSAKTALRLPTTIELGTSFPTYVKDGHTVRKESLNVVREGYVVARNTTTIGKDSEGNLIFNEWLVADDVIVKNYGQDALDSLTIHFQSYKKNATIKAIPLTPHLITLFDIQGDTLPIQVSWSPEPMIAKVGDFLTDGGYSISAHDMLSYDIVN